MEDDSALARMIQMILTVDGHEVTMAGGNEKALAMVKAADYDLVITGFDMPGMNGLELARAIRAASPAQPIMLLISYIGQIPDDKTALSDVTVILAKPFTMAHLHEAVARILAAL
jgi:CheY-like chemotaxis protein